MNNLLAGCLVITLLLAYTPLYAQSSKGESLKVCQIIDKVNTYWP